MERVVRPPVMSLEEVIAYAHAKMGGIHRHLDCLEIGGQSMSIRDGFAKRGMTSDSFDCRVLALNCLFFEMMADKSSLIGKNRAVACKEGCVSQCSVLNG